MNKGQDEKKGCRYQFIKLFKLILPQSKEAIRLLWLGILPVFDGCLISAMSAGILNDYWQAASFGIIALSGAGCFVAAMEIQGESLGEK